VTGRRQVVDAILRVVAEPAPAAYYACAVCPYTASVKAPATPRGRAKVAAFVETTRTHHRATCPNLHRTERNRAA
jgi:hypothetical protein